MELDTDLCNEASSWALATCNAFDLARQSPEHPLSGDCLELYRQLTALKLLDNYDASNKMYLVQVLMLLKYRDLLWHKTHPPKPKMSKWERVTGRRPKR